MYFLSKEIELLLLIRGRESVATTQGIHGGASQAPFSQQITSVEYCGNKIKGKKTIQSSDTKEIKV